VSDTLFTLARECEFAQDTRKSRFLALASPAATPEAALAYLKLVSDPGATHNCWAYRVGEAYRYSDDGEPGASAGRPILQAIDGQRCDRVMVVVTRWYGGINLGVGGLIRAYGGTAAECLRIGPRIPIVELARLSLRCDFGDLTLVKVRLADFGATIDSEQFDIAGVNLAVHLPEGQAEAAMARIADISRGRIAVHRD
jgi:uncharacterized YigZ family protein